MTVVRRKRSDNFTIVPNIVAEDQRLSFEERGLLTYLLAKPNDWTVTIPDIMANGGVGRDKAYKLLKGLRQAGYIAVETVRDQTGRITEHNYIVYDCAVPDRLPLPEKPEPATPLPEKPDVDQPLPENPDAGFAVSGKSGRNNKNSKLPISPLPPGTDRLGFGQLLQKLTLQHRTSSLTLARKMFENLPAQVERDNAIACWPLYERIQVRRGKKPNLVTFIRERAWRELVDAPPVDKDGDFVITPDREEWQPWLDAVRATHGEVGVASARRLGRILRKDRWPPACSPQMAMPLG